MATPIALTLSPASFTPAVGRTTQMTATVTYDDATTADVTAECAWSSSDNSVATVSASGLVSILAVGSASISASFTQSGAVVKTTQVTEDFNRAITTLTDRSWVKPAAFTYAIDVANNRARAPKSWSGKKAAALWNVALESDDQWAQITWPTGQDGTNYSGPKGVMVRCNAACDTYYYCGLDNAAGGYVNAFKMVAGVKTALSVGGTMSIGVGDSFGLQVVGNVITLLKNGAPTGYHCIDSSIPSGDYIGIRMEGQVGNTDYAYFDDFAGGDWSTDAVTVTGAASLTSYAIVADTLTLTPSALVLAAGQTAALALSVHYSDDSNEDHTSDAEWSSSDATVATVSTSGVVTAVAEGEATITASFAGLTVTAAVTVFAQSMLLKLDQKVTLTAGIDYVVMLVLPAVKRAEGTVEAVSSSLVTVATDWGGADRVRRLVVDGQDVAVESASMAGGITYLKLASEAAITAGQACELWDTDVLETRSVLTAPGETDTLEVIAFSALPDAYTTYFFGQLSDVQDFRVSMVGRRSDQEMTLQLTKYDPTMYGNLEPALSPAIDAGGLIAVSNLVALESPNASPENPIVNVTWKPGKLTAGVRLYLSRGGLPEYLAADIKGRNFAELGVTAGIEYTVRAVGYDLRGYSAPYATAPTATFTALGAGLLPANVAGFYASACVADPASVTLNWTANPVADDVDHYEIRYGGTIANPAWAFSTVLEPNPAGSATSATFASGPGQYLIIAVNSGGYASSLATVCTAVVGGSSGGTGGGGYGGGGDTCFSGNVEIETPEGWVRFDQLPERFRVRNDFGDFEAILAVHDYAGPMIDFSGDGQLVTPGHLMRYERRWRPASLHYATAPRVPFQGKVYSARVRSKVPGEQCFRLRNGDVAHNMKAPRDYGTEVNPA